MQTSRKGISFLERHEGVVLKAYRDPVGILTIGAGLTKASGVVVPRPGMRITAQEASRLLARALQRNYEPAVRAEMARAKQHEFDGGVAFHFNTGAIRRASWVKAWRQHNWVAVRARIKLWNKGGGRVLPGLVRRRDEEYRLMRYGDYGAAAGARPVRSAPGAARIALPLSKAEIAEARKALASLGYGPGTLPEGLDQLAVRAFQRDHDLAVDGIVGRATLSTLQRRIDAKRKATTTAATTGGGAAGVEGADQTGIMPALPDWALWVVLGGGAIWLCWLAFTYRDVVAAKIERRLPRAARFLRSF